MPELRNYFTKYFVVRAKKRRNSKQRQLYIAANYLEGYGYYKEEDVKEKSKKDQRYAKERSKERPEKKRKGYITEKLSGNQHRLARHKELLHRVRTEVQ